MNVQIKRARSAILAAAVAALVTACASTPDSIRELEAARAVVPQVEASPRAGVAAENVSEARKSLERANQAADRGEVGDAKYHANVATTNAQIANEKILTAQAQEALEKGTVERQRVLLEARTAETEQAQQRASTLEQELHDLQAKRTDRGLMLTLGDVLFDTGKATLKPGAYTTIDRLANALKEVPTRVVAIEGHTDSVGAEDYNQQLSQQRALAVQAALMQRGVNGSQISALGKGEGFPVAGNDNAAGRQQNRRVEVIFTEGASQVVSDRH
jgi:OmpA-OmpF porin, OOP family